MSKIATIKNFSNMEESGAYYLEGMVARKINGKSILTPGYLNSFVLSEDTSGFSALGVVKGGTSFQYGTEETGTAAIIDDSGHIYGIDIVSSTHLGLFHTSTLVTANTDIAVTKNENLLYSNTTHLGFGLKGTADSGSTTTLVDAAVAFDTLIAGAGAGINKMYSFTNEEEYTITSLTGSNTLNFDAGTAIDTDSYMVFLDTGKTNGGDDWNFFPAGATYPHFVGQETQASFKRQIELFDTNYLIGNGNYLAALNVNETTWNANYKQLPDQTQFQCMGKNQDRLLVGAVRRGKGVLLLWDGYSDGWLAIEELEQIPTAIRAYSSGWLVMVGTSVYYSNGYQTKFLTKFPDTDDLDGLANTFYNSMLAIKDKIIVNADIDDYFRNKSGVWIYEFGSGWTLTPYNNGLSNPLNGITSGAVFSAVDFPDNPKNRYIFTSFEHTEGAASSCLNRIIDRIANKYSSMFYVNLPKKYNISEIKLNISPQFDGSAVYGTVVIDVAVGDGKNQFWRQSTCGASSTTTLLKNSFGGTSNQAGIVGQQIRMLEGDTAGERSYVTSIANAGTNSEELTISPALSANPDNSEVFNMVALKHADQQSFSGLAIPDEIPFITEGFYSDKLFFEVAINTTSATKIDIHSIDIYGD
jgi:hypothetical protein